MCWIYLNYWSCWRHLGRETVVSQAKIWQNDRCQLCSVSQNTREHSATNHQAHSFATAENLVGMEFSHFSMTGLPWMLNVKRSKVAIWQLKRVSTTTFLSLAKNWGYFLIEPSLPVSAQHWPVAWEPWQEPQQPRVHPTAPRPEMLASLTKNPDFQAKLWQRGSSEVKPRSKRGTAGSTACQGRSYGHAGEQPFSNKAKP